MVRFSSEEENQLGFDCHRMHTKYTGTAVRIMVKPMAVSTGCCSIGKIVMPRVIDK